MAITTKTPTFINNWRALAPGLLVVILIGIISEFISRQWSVGGKHPLEASALAIVLGLIVVASRLVPASAKDGIKYSDKLLVLGIVFMGAGLDLGSVLAQGSTILLIVLMTMTAGMVCILLLSKLFKLKRTLGILLAVGTTICGTSAIAITAPLLKANEAETSYAVSVVAFCGLVAIFLYPLLGQYIGMNDVQFGVFAGASIHSTPQVIGAGFLFSSAAGQLATVVKLVRNCFMAPLAMLIGTLEARCKNLSSQKVNISKAFPWFLFGYFIMAGLNSAGFFTVSISNSFTDLGKFLVVLGMAGVGLGTSFSSFRTLGIKPLFVGVIGTAIVGVVCFVLIKIILVTV